MNPTKYNPAIHHRKSIRLKGYDYSQEGLYFITICTHNRECFFGNIVDKQIIMNDAGNIVDACWKEIPKHFPNTVLHEYIVMPNHVHGIIELTNDDAIGGTEFVGAENFLPLQQQNNGTSHVGIQNFKPLRKSDDVQKQNSFQKIIPHSIGSIVKGFKIGVTKWVRNNMDVHDVWQRNFHDHIIRDEKSYRNISNYIINNPASWNEDKFYHA